MEKDDDVWFSFNDGMDLESMRNPIPVKYFKYRKSVPLPQSSDFDKTCYESPIPESWLEHEFPDPATRPTLIRCGEFRASIKNIPVTQIPYLLFASYFFNKKNIERYLSPFLRRKIDVSLCNLDWMLTNYSKEKDVGYRLVRDQEKVSFETPQKEYVLLNFAYSATLNMYRRRHFGSFRRSTRCWTVGENGLVTTVGQLLFLMWCLDWCVFDCTALLLKDLESHKLLRVDENRRDIQEFKVRGEKRPRKELVEEAPQKLLLVRL